MEPNGGRKENITVMHISPVTVSHLFHFSPARKVQKDKLTVDTPAAAKTLSAWHDCRAISERCARAAFVHTHGARTWRNVRQEARGLPVRRIVIRRGPRLEYEDAQVRVCRSKTACDDATSSATCRRPLCQKG